MGIIYYCFIIIILKYLYKNLHYKSMICHVIIKAVCVYCLHARLNTIFCRFIKIQQLIVTGEILVVTNAKVATR